MRESEDHGIVAMRGGAANDNGGTAARIDAAVMTLARLLGRRIAREEFDCCSAWNIDPLLGVIGVQN